MKSQAAAFMLVGALLVGAPLFAVYATDPGESPPCPAAGCPVSACPAKPVCKDPCTATFTIKVQGNGTAPCTTVPCPVPCVAAGKCAPAACYKAEAKACCKAEAKACCKDGECCCKAACCCKPAGDPVVAELVDILQATDESETMLFTSMVLGKMGPSARSAIPAMIRNADRLKLFKGITKEEGGAKAEMAENLFNSIEEILNVSDRKAVGCAPAAPIAICVPLGAAQFAGPFNHPVPHPQMMTPPCVPMPPLPPQMAVPGIPVSAPQQMPVPMPPSE